MVQPVYKPLVWIVSDSFVHWLGQAVYLQAILSNVATIQWLGKRGLYLDEFNDFLHQCWESEQLKNPEYMYIIIHVISDDMGTLPKKATFKLIKNVLTITRSLLPHTIMF
jgi:hypothetical protein